MLFSIHTFELTLNTNDYDELKTRAYNNAVGSHRIIEMKRKEDYYVVHCDLAMVSYGIRVEYHDNGFRKYIKFIVNPSKVLGSDDIPQLWKTTDKNIKTLIKTLKTSINEYFDFEIKLNDFKITRVDFTINIDVGSRENVSSYIKILHAMGKVKGFSPKYKKTNKWINKDLSFDLVKTTPYIEFSAYDKQAQSGMKEAKNILRVEIRLMKFMTRKNTTTKFIKALSKECKQTFMQFFQCIVPRGDYYVKDQLIELVQEGIATIVPNKRERNNTLDRMMRLIELIPKKKSLHLAQKCLGYRDINRIMSAFTELNVSPVAIPRSMKVKYLDSLYTYLEDECR